ncbi:MAG: heme ABC transporter ATP-binding protein [Chloroflexi bacterium]|nr:heme ABC transporter ATP-binding protein [Chloroflexota bacterium]MCY3696302.1 heme ABC transporter ATP-binding protein [Chloroflexota bacterium]MYD16858.1 heme ABC transporter ATP-binding protein [Chloroflexota bacterium]MYJ02029.1 heme ABC transporter ATP-binding protein [Chloroflexota bacterium]
MTNVQPAIRGDELVVRVEDKMLLDGVSLSVRGGELVGVVGPNGAGKTTLLKALSGDLPLDSGDVFIDERPLSSFTSRELARRRAVMPQSSYLPFLFTAREVVRMGRAPWEGERGEREHGARLTDYAMSLTDTRDYAVREYPTLSGGEQSRVTFARVLAQETPILLIDEPTAHLDLRHQHLVLQLAQELASEGAAVVAVLHDLNLAAMYSDTALVLHRGRTVAYGPVDEALEPELLAPVFGMEFVLQSHPNLERPMLVPLPASVSHE